MNQHNENIEAHNTYLLSCSSTQHESNKSSVMCCEFCEYVLAPFLDAVRASWNTYRIIQHTNIRCHVKRTSTSCNIAYDNTIQYNTTQYTHMCTHAYMYAHVNTLMHKRMHAYIRARMHAHTQTHMNKQTRAKTRHQNCVPG